MQSDHFLWLGDNFEEGSIERGLHNAVVELDHEHELLIASNHFADKLAVLHFVIVEALCIPSVVLVILSDNCVFIIMGRNDTDVSIEDVDRLLDDVFVSFVRLLTVLEPWIDLDAHETAHFILVFLIFRA